MSSEADQLADLLVERYLRGELPSDTSDAITEYIKSVEKARENLNRCLNIPPQIHPPLRWRKPPDAGMARP